MPPIVLLAAVHGIALAVRAGASGRIYFWAVSAVAVIGVGAFAVSFLVLRDLMRAIGYTSATAWAFPAIIDTAVAVSTLMLVALGEKPARRTRNATTPAGAEIPAIQRAQSARAQATPGAPRKANAQCVQDESAKAVASVPPGAVHTVQSAHTEATHADANLASDLIASGVTTQSVDTVIAVLSSHRHGASINAAAKASGINYRTAQRIVDAAKHRQRQLMAVG